MLMIALSRRSDLKVIVCAKNLGFSLGLNGGVQATNPIRSSPNILDIFQYALSIVHLCTKIIKILDLSEWCN